MMTLWTVFFMAEVSLVGFGALFTYRFAQGQMIPRIASTYFSTVGWRNMIAFLAGLSLFTTAQTMSLLQTRVLIRLVVILPMAGLWLWFFRQHKMDMLNASLTQKIRSLRRHPLGIVFSIVGLGFIITIVSQRFQLGFFSCGLFLALFGGLIWLGDDKEHRLLDKLFILIVGWLSLALLG